MHATASDGTPQSSLRIRPPRRFGGEVNPRLGPDPPARPMPSGFCASSVRGTDVTIGDHPDDARSTGPDTTGTIPQSSSHERRDPLAPNFCRCNSHADFRRCGRVVSEQPPGLDSQARGGDQAAFNGGRSWHDVGGGNRSSRAKMHLAKIAHDGAKFATRGTRLSLGAPGEICRAPSRERLTPRFALRRKSVAYVPEARGPSCAERASRAARSLP